MNRIGHPFREVDIVGKLADLKEDHYRNVLILSALVELLVDKGVITQQELQAKLNELDTIIPDPTYPIS